MKKYSIIIITLTLTFTTCSFSSLNKAPRASKGVIDLSGWDFKRDGILNLDGEWAFYWKSLISPEKLTLKNSFNKPDLYIDFPGQWNKYSDPGDREKKIGSDGYATYILKIKGLDSGAQEKLALSLKYAHTSYRLYFIPGDKRSLQHSPSGKHTPLLKNGIVSKSKKDAVPEWKPETEIIKDYDNTNYILIHVSNYQHSYGGIRFPIKIGDKNRIFNHRDAVFSITFTMIGVLLIMFFYYLQFFLKRNDFKATLCFSLYCATIAVFYYVGSNAINIHFSQRGIFNFELIRKIELIAYYASVPLFYNYLQRLFPDEFNKIIGKIVLIATIVLSISTVIFQYKTYFGMLQISYLITIFVCLYAFCMLIKSAVKRRVGSLASLIGVTILVVTALISILPHLKLLPFIMTSSHLLIPYGFIVFVFFQNNILSQIFTNSQKKSDNLNLELSELNKKLECIVKDRTQDLETIIQYMAEENIKLSDLNIIDGLTGIKNRRFFNDKITKYWNEAHRQKNPMSLLMIDIDFFKKVNDTYGHQAGDTCLIDVAQILKRNLRRPFDEIMRYGGEEFAAILPNTDEEGAIHVAESIRKKIEETAIEIDDGSISLTVSIGISVMIPKEINKDEQLVSNADKALYEAKENGRNQVRVFKDNNNSGGV